MSKETQAAEIVDTYKLNKYAQPRNSFYGKAYVERTADENGATTYHLISYGTKVASASYSHKVGCFELHFKMFDIDDNATATTRRHLKAFAELIGNYAQGAYTSDKALYIHVSATTKRTAGRILPLRHNRSHSFVIIYDEKSGTVSQAASGLVTRLLKQYPLPSTIRKYEIAKECRSMFWGYDWYAHIVGDEDGQPLVERSAYYRL